MCCTPKCRTPIRSYTPMLTEAECKNAISPPDKKQAWFADFGGMYLQVSPAGSKRWFLKYRVCQQQVSPTTKPAMKTPSNSRLCRTGSARRASEPTHIGIVSAPLPPIRHRLHHLPTPAGGGDGVLCRLQLEELPFHTRTLMPTGTSTVAKAI